MEIQSIKQAECLPLYYSYYDPNRDYETYRFKLDDGWHLVIDGVDVLDGCDAIECHYHRDGGDYSYQDINGFWHLIRNWVDVLAGLNATRFERFEYRDYYWTTRKFCEVDYKYYTTEHGWQEHKTINYFVLFPPFAVIVLFVLYPLLMIYLFTDIFK